MHAIIGKFHADTIDDAGQYLGYAAISGVMRTALSEGIEQIKLSFCVLSFTKYSKISSKVILVNFSHN